MIRHNSSMDTPAQCPWFTSQGKGRKSSLGSTLNIWHSDGMIYVLVCVCAMCTCVYVCVYACAHALCVCVVCVCVCVSVHLCVCVCACVCVCVCVCVCSCMQLLFGYACCDHNWVAVHEWVEVEHKFTGIYFHTQNSLLAAPIASSYPGPVARVKVLWWKRIIYRQKWTHG